MACEAENEIMSDLPRYAVTRTARLARLPVGFAGRTALGTGKRLGGRPAELVNQEIQQRTADQVFRVLGELKGGAMKLGQALSVFEAALPPEIAEPYRATLTRGCIFSIGMNICYLRYEPSCIRRVRIFWGVSGSACSDSCWSAA
jgi:hypothetical protein